MTKDEADPDPEYIAFVKDGCCVACKDIQCCGSGACEGCACCVAGACVFGADGDPKDDLGFDNEQVAFYEQTVKEVHEGKWNR